VGNDPEWGGWGNVIAIPHLPEVASVRAQTAAFVRAGHPFVTTDPEEFGTVVRVCREQGTNLAERIQIWEFHGQTWYRVRGMSRPQEGRDRGPQAVE
jgi:hypothetical protein